MVNLVRLSLLSNSMLHFVAWQRHVFGCVRRALQWKSESRCSTVERLGLVCDAGLWCIEAKRECVMVHWTLLF